jgi:hypothetical protein
MKRAGISRDRGTPDAKNLLSEREIVCFITRAPAVNQKAPK